MSQKESKECQEESQLFSQVQARFYQKIQQQYRTGIIKVEVDNTVYLFTFARMGKSQSYFQYLQGLQRPCWGKTECQLILSCNRQYHCTLGFTLRSSGFPFNPRSHPRQVENIELGGYEETVIKDKVLQIKTRRGPWYVYFQSKKLPEEWQKLIESAKKMHQARTTNNMSQQFIGWWQTITTCKQISPLLAVPTMPLTLMNESLINFDSNSTNKNGQPYQQYQNEPKILREQKQKLPNHLLNYEKRQESEQIKNEIESKTEETPNKEEQNKIEELQNRVILLQKERKQEKEKYESQKLMLQGQIDNIKQEAQKSRQQYLAKIADLEKDLTYREETVLSIQKERDSLNDKNKQIKSKNEDLVKVNENLIKQNEDLVKQNEGLVKQKERVGKQLELVNAEKDKYRQQIHEKNNNIENLRKQINQLKIHKQERNWEIFFHGDLLTSFPEHKPFIKNQVEKLKQRKISRTSLIFKMDPLNTTSFHKYIDTIPDIVLVVKTKTGLFFGAYSESSFHPEQMADRQGIIFSINQEKVFPLLQGKRPVTYDAFYLIIGNSEIRLKQGEEKVFCNFGINNGHYDPKGSSVDDLLGEGKDREALIAGYEVHHIEFQ